MGSGVNIPPPPAWSPRADFIALVIGRIATPEKITNIAFFLGVIIFIVLLIFGILLSKGEE
jgi:hypothetical protein